MSTTARRVLYVDDSKDNRTVFQHTYSPLFLVETCESGERAVAILAERPAHVVVTDQRMPGMSGLELLEHVRETAPATLRYLVSAFLQKDDLEQHADGCVQGFYPKPWGAELREALSRGTEVDDVEALLARADEGIAALSAEVDRVVAEDDRRHGAAEAI